MERWRTWLVGPAVLAIVALLGGACEETTEDDAGETTTEATSRTTRGVTDDAVKIGGIFFDVNFSGADVGAEARIRRANDEGGVNGRTIELVSATNDGNEAAANLEEAQRLVTQEEVFAIVPMVTGAASGSVDFLLDENVPFFGWGIDPAFCGNEIGFGFTGCVTDPDLQRGSNALGTVLAEQFDGDTDRTVAIIADDSDAGKGGLRLLTPSLEDTGFRVVYAEPVIPAAPATTSDFTPFVNDLLRADAGAPPDIIMVQLSNLDAAGLSGALKAAGFEGLIITPLYSPLLLGSEQAAADLDGSAVLMQIQPYEVDPQPPALERMVEDVQAISPDEPLGLGLAAGYWSVDFFLSVLEATGDDVTVERFLQTANDDFEWEAPDVVGRSTWPVKHDEPVPCAALPMVQDGAYVPNVDLTCGEVIDVE